MHLDCLLVTFMIHVDKKPFLCTHKFSDTGATIIYVYYDYYLVMAIFFDNLKPPFLLPIYLCMFSRETAFPRGHSG